MTSFYELYEKIQEERYFTRLALNPMAQFQSEQGTLLGASLLPERLVEENSYEETTIRYKIKPALYNNRYSPTQMQDGGRIVGSFTVSLSHTDTQKQMSSKEHDDLMKLLGQGGDVQAMSRVISWSDNQLIRPHTINNEIARFESLLLGRVNRVTTDGQMEPIEYYRPPNHVVTIAGGTTAAPAGWYAGDYDPFPDMELGVRTLQRLGYRAIAMYSMPDLGYVLRDNEKIKERNQYAVVNDAGQVGAAQRQLTFAGLDRLIIANELPMLTTYNNGYESIDEGFKRYMDVEDGYDYLIIVGATTRNYDLATDYVGTTGTQVEGFTDGAIDLENVMGYVALGRNAGEASPGRTINTKVSDVKPKGLWGESYQTGLPVPQDPQSYYILRIQKPVES